MASAPDQEMLADVFARACTSRATFEDVTGKWASLVLIALAEEPRRFSELRRRVDGVSEKMLAQALRALERDGMVTRTVGEGRSARVDYALTELGADVASRLRGLADILEAAVPKVKAARAAYGDAVS